MGFEPTTSELEVQRAILLRHRGSTHMFSRNIDKLSILRFSQRYVILVLCFAIFTT